MLAEEAEKFWRGAIVGVLVGWQALCLQHVFKDAQPNALSLQGLMNVEIKYATWFDLRHCPASDKQIFVTCLQQGQRFGSLNDHVQKLVSL